MKMALTYRAVAVRTIGILAVALLILGAVFLAKDKGGHHHTSASSALPSTLHTSSLSDNAKESPNEASMCGIGGIEGVIGGIDLE